MTVVFACKSIHFKDDLFRATQLDHRFCEELVADEDREYCHISSFDTFFEIDLPCGIFCNLVSSRTCDRVAGPSWCRSSGWHTLLASFHAASPAPCSCHSISSSERSSNFGALGLRSWSSPGQIYPNEGFWSRILVWRAMAFVNFTRWIGLGMSVPFRRIDFGGVMSWNTQPNCRASDHWRFDEFRPNFFHLLSSSPDRSGHWSVRSPHPCEAPFFTINTTLLSLFDWDLFVGCSSTWRSANEHFFSKPTTTLGLEERAFWRVPCHFTKWITASSSKSILAKPSRHSAAGTFSSATSGPRWFSLILPHERIRRRIWWWTFPTLIHIVAETAIVSFHTLPVGFPLPTNSKILEEPELHRQNPDDLASVQRGGTSAQKHEHVFVFVSVSSCRNPHIHQTRTTTHDQLRHPCFGDHSRLVWLCCNLLHRQNQCMSEGQGKCGETNDHQRVQPESHPDWTCPSTTQQRLHFFSQQNGEFGLWCHVLWCDVV